MLQQVLFMEGAGVASSSQLPGPSAALFATPYYSRSGTQYYVNSSTGSDSYNGTSATFTSGSNGPWATLTHAASVNVGAGSVINCAGTFATGPGGITHGGNAASSTGYVVWRSSTLGGAVITDDGGGPGVFNIQANYVIIDGFTMTASSQVSNGCGVSVFNGTNAYTFQNHHIWVLNCTISEYGQAGLQLNEGEFFYVIHNTINNNATNPSYGGSGISFANAMPIPSYSLTADDQNNSVTGNTGTLFRNFIMWNSVYNNYEAGSGGGGDTDGNGIIIDTYQWNNGIGGTGGTSGSSVYTNGCLIAFNLSYNNGGGGVHVFGSCGVTVANNSCYNNYLDLNNNAQDRPCIDTTGSYGNTIVNNICYAIGGSSYLAYNTAIGPCGVGVEGYTPFETTLNGTITSTAATLAVASVAAMPGGSVGEPHIGYSLPGGNMIQIDSEIILVGAGWGTTTLSSLTRGYYGTTKAAHSSGATVIWVQDYFSNNITYATGGAADVNGPFNGDVYNSVSSAGASLSNTGSLPNLEATNPLWVNVGNTSSGTISTPPNGADFALQSGSPAIGYGLTFSWLNSQSVNAGAITS